MTIYHQGKHTCTPKPNVEEKRQVAAEKCKELPPLNLELRNTPREFQIDLIGYYIATGQLEKGKKLAELLSHKRLLQVVEAKVKLILLKMLANLNQVQMNLIGVTYTK